MQITKFLFRIACGVALGLLLTPFRPAAAQQSLTWEQIKAKFEAANPTLKGDAINVQEMKAEEVTAYLRPNPQFTLSQDGTQIASHDGTWTPLKGTYVVPTVSYLHEREHKRELRLQSAQEGTQISSSQHEDLERNLVFNLRVALLRPSRPKQSSTCPDGELDYYDHIIDISRARFKERRSGADRSRPHRTAAGPV